MLEGKYTFRCPCRKPQLCARFPLGDLGGFYENPPNSMHFQLCTKMHEILLNFVILSNFIQNVRQNSSVSLYIAYLIKVGHEIAIR